MSFSTDIDGTPIKMFRLEKIKELYGLLTDPENWHDSILVGELRDWLLKAEQYDLLRQRDLRVSRNGGPAPMDGEPGQDQSA